MKPETLIDVLGLGLRATEAALSRRPADDRPDTKVDKLVRRVLPFVERALDRAAGGTAGPKGKVADPKSDGAGVRAERRAARRRKRSALAPLISVAVGAVTAGSVAYVIVKEQQRIRERYRPLRAEFPTELLEVLAAPGGGGRLNFNGHALIDPATGAAYGLLDGIPDFIGPPASPAEQVVSDDSWAQDLLRPVGLFLAGRNHAGNAAFSSAVASGAGQGWVLSVPAGRGTYEVEMAHANPRARVLCLGNKWDALLEARRRARAAGLTNLYFVRGIPRLLPIQDKVMAGLWTNGLQRYAAPERELTQMIRATRPNAPVAGVSLVEGGPAFNAAVVRLGQRYLPGLRSAAALTALLQAAGLRDLRFASDGSFLRFSALRA